MRKPELVASSPMEKAYDFKVYAARLKDLGIENAEEIAEDVYKMSTDFLDESAQKSETPMDDFVPLVTKYADGVVLPLIDKIDGQEG